MTVRTADQNLLFGLLALQTGFVSREDLVAAVSVWLEDKSRQLDQIFLERKSLGRDEHELVAALVRKHLDKHGGNAEQSLAALSSLDSAGDELKKLGDAELEATLAVVARQRKSDVEDAERTLVVGDRTSGGQRFRVLRPHAKGGLGEVFVAQDIELHREVALKEIQLHYAHDADSRARFVLEAEITGGLEHPGIVPVYGLGQYADGRPFYAMRFIRGDSLKEAVDRFHVDVGRTSSPSEIHRRTGTPSYDSVEFRKLLGRFIDVCQAIEYAHSRGVLHRDLKPGNIMLGKYGETLVVDWGLAKARGRSETKTPAEESETTLRPASAGGSSATQMGSAVGTPAYMSPEQAAGRLDQLGPPADVYSLGATLYYVLTGTAPFGKEDLGTTLRKVQAGEFPPPRSSSPSVPRALESICLKAMALRPEDRYRTPAALADDVEKWLADEPVNAHRETTLAKASRWVRKHRAWAMSGAAALALVAVVATVAAVLIAQKERTATELATRNAALAEEKTTLAELAEARRETAEDQEKMAVAALARSNYFLAAARWKERRVDEAFELLESVPSEHRNFEWYLARRQFEGSDVTLFGHIDTVNSVAYSPDGSRLASASKDKTIKMWDARTGAELRTLSGHAGWVNSVTYSPDGSRVASASGDETIKLWDARTGAELRTLSGHSKSVISVAFSPDGSRLASASNDQTIKLWNAHTGAELRTLTGHSEPVWSVVFSPDGSRLASASGDNTIKLWDARTGAELHTLSGHSSYVMSVAFSPDGSRLASASLDKTIKLWDARTGAASRTLTGHSEGVKGVVFSPDGSGLASASGATWINKPGEIKLWDLRTGAELRTLSGHSHGVESVAFSPDGSRLASASLDKTIKLWDARTGARLRTLSGHSRGVESVAFSRNGSRLASGSSDHTIKLWDSRTGAELHTLIGHSESVNSVAFSSDGSWLASGSEDNTIKLWDARTGAELRALSGHSESVNSVAFSPDGACLVSGSWDNTIKLWDALTGAELRTLTGHSEPVWSVAFSPDGSWLASASDDFTVKLWDARTYAEIRTFIGHADEVKRVVFSPDGSRLASGCDDETIKLWDARTGAELRTLIGHSDDVLSVAFSPDGSRVASASGKEVKLWDALTGVEICTLTGHSDGVNSVVFSPDGSRLASASDDETVKLWDAPTSVELRMLIGHSHVVRRVAFSLDGARLASAASRFGWEPFEIKLWDARTGADLHTLAGQATNVAFSPDGSRLFSHDSSGKPLAWDTVTGHLLPEPEERSDFNAIQNRTADGKWLAVSSGKHVRLVDLTFKDDLEEKANREFKARLDPWWHDERAREAETATPQPDWYSAVFHLAWLLKARPEDADAHDRLHAAHEQWTKEFVAQRVGDADPAGATPVSKNPDDYLAPVVREMLKLSAAPVRE